MGTLDPSVAPASIAARAVGSAAPLSSILPATHATGQGGQPPAPRPASTAVALAATLSGLLEGALIEALVLGRDHDGGTVLKTAVGTFVAAPSAGQTAAAMSTLLPANARAVLHALSVGDLLQTRLVSVDDAPPATPQIMTLRLTALTPRALGEHPAPGPSHVLTTAPAPYAPRLATEAAGSPAGAVARPTIVPPAPSVAPAEPLRVGQTVLAVVQAAAPSAPQPLPAGTALGLRVVAVVAPGAAPPRSVMQGALVGETAMEGGPEHERPVLRLAGATLRLPPTVAVPAGSQVVVELIASAPPPGTARHPDQDRLMAELQTVLAPHLVDPAIAARVAERVPSPGRRLAAAALLFLAAARQGDLAGWLHAAAPSRADTDAEPLKRLAAGWQGFLGGYGDETAASEAWHPWMLPFHDGIGLRPLTFQLRRRASKPDGGSTEIRFLLDLDLSALGALQLDGLIHARRFDLVLRGAGRLDVAMRRELSLLFLESLGAVGYVGAINFQNERAAAPVAAPRTVVSA